MNRGNPTKDEFFDLIIDEVLDDFLEDTVGHAAVEQVELGSMSKVEYQALIDASIKAYNDALDNCNTSMAAVHYRNIQRLLALDDETREHYENPTNAFNGVGFVDMSDFMGDR